MVEINKIYVGDCIDVMKSWPENFVDTIITDPPYGLDFMGKDWDGDVPGVRFWQEMIRICKPGATLLTFGGTRTWHHLATAIEKAGWQIRDCLMWLYGSGFPKSHNLHWEFEGWGTALKPAWEPIIVAMKPIDGTFAQNAEKWGVAGINVDGGRIGTPESKRAAGTRKHLSGSFAGGINGGGELQTAPHDGLGRWPANLLLDEEAAAMLDGASGCLISGDKKPTDKRTTSKGQGRAMGYMQATPDNYHGSTGGASRFFYVAKADRAERNEGCDDMASRPSGGMRGRHDGSMGSIVMSKNHHPTVKPLSLMKYLSNLTRTPTGGIVLDPFAGSGTTLWAAEFHNRPWIGIEMDAEYVAIANARIANERSQMKMAI